MRWPRGTAPPWRSTSMGFRRATTSLPAPIAVGNKDVYLGSSDGSYDWLHGLIDELAVYGTALPASRIRAHYEKAHASRLTRSPRRCGHRARSPSGRRRWRAGRIPPGRSRTPPGRASRRRCSRSTPTRYRRWSPPATSPRAPVAAMRRPRRCWTGCQGRCSPWGTPPTRTGPRRSSRTATTPHGGATGPEPDRCTST